VVVSSGEAVWTKPTRFERFTRLNLGLWLFGHC
jgi:hypothetical protein